MDQAPDDEEASDLDLDFELPPIDVELRRKTFHAKIILAIGMAALARYALVFHRDLWGSGRTSATSMVVIVLATATWVAWWELDRLVIRLSPSGRRMSFSLLIGAAVLLIGLNLRPAP